MIPNTDSNGIHYGYIAADSLDPDLVCELQSRGRDVHYEEALDDLRHAIYNALAEAGVPIGGPRSEVCYEAERVFDLYWEGSDEPIHEGEMDGVKYRTSWLGGALHVWVFESPVTGNYQECSPCVPGAGNLDCPDPNGVLTYDVPPEWRWEDET